MQDKSIVQIGKVKMPKVENDFEYFIQNMFPGENYEMLTADFLLKKAEGNWTCEFTGIDLKEASSKNYSIFAYRKGSSRGGDITFTTKSGDFEKKLRTVQKQAEDISAFCRSLNVEDEIPVFDAFKSCFKDENNYKHILKIVSERYALLPKEKQQKSGFTIRFQQEGKEKYLAEFRTVQLQLLKSGNEGKSEKYDVISEGRDKCCSVCLEKKPLVHGFGSPFKYSTVDKPGFVSGFFRQENNWKSYPICSSCALAFEMGRNWVVEKMSRSFYGRFYYIIPKMTINRSPEFFQKILDYLEDLRYSEENKDISTKEEYVMRKIAREFGEKDDFALNLLFYEENQTTKAIKIKLHLEEIVPSRFREIFEETPDKIKDHPLYIEAIPPKKDEPPEDLKFNFGILREFFDERFYEIVQSVFMGFPLEREVLYKAFIERYRERRKERKIDDLTIRKAHLVMNFFDQLGIITSPTNHSNMEEIISTEENQSEKGKSFDLEKYLNFVRDNQSFLGGDDVREGVFALGIWVKYLLNLQYAKLGTGNSPFEKTFKGFQMNPESLKSLAVKTLAKYNDYQSAGYHTELRSIIHKKFTMNVLELKKYSNNDLSFYFVAGLELASQFKRENTDN